jgi:hypothetical protein
VDIGKIENNRKSRKSRNNRPVKAFLDLFSATDQALKEVAKLGASKETQDTLSKSHIINIVTAVEVYYRDMLDSIFRICAPSSFESKLKKLHDKTYKIDDLLSIYTNNIHPLELIANNISFQNITNIEKTFSLLIGKPFFKQTRNIKWRLKDDPEAESEIFQKDIDTLQDLFEYRHLLIHNPNQSINTSINDIEDQINSMFGVIMASDLVLTTYINENTDPELVKEQKS